MTAQSGKAGIRQVLKESVVEGTATLKDWITTLKGWITVLGWLVIVFAPAAALIWMLLPDSITDPVKYQSIYSVDKSHVFIEKRPTDCDWGHAPIGGKDCHYDKTVFPAKDANGRVTDVYVGWNKVQD